MIEIIEIIQLRLEREAPRYPRYSICPGAPEMEVNKITTRKHIYMLFLFICLLFPDRLVNVRWYLTIPSSDQWWITIENHHFQWLPATIPFNGDSTPENHWNFSMVANTGFKLGLNCCKCLEKSQFSVWVCLYNL